MKSYEMIASHVGVGEATLGSDTSGLAPLQVVTVLARGMLIANQAEATFAIALGSADAKDLGNALLAQAEIIPTLEAQNSNYTKEVE